MVPTAKEMLFSTGILFRHFFSFQWIFLKAAFFPDFWKIQGLFQYLGNEFVIFQVFNNTQTACKGARLF